MSDHNESHEEQEGQDQPETGQEQVMAIEEAVRRNANMIRTQLARGEDPLKIAIKMVTCFFEPTLVLDGNNFKGALSLAHQYVTLVQMRQRSDELANIQIPDGVPADLGQEGK